MKKLTDDKEDNQYKKVGAEKNKEPVSQKQNLLQSKNVKVSFDHNAARNTINDKLASKELDLFLHMYQDIKEVKIVSCIG